MHDDHSRWNNLPLAEVRYDIQHSSAVAFYTHEGWPALDQGLVALAREWLQKRFGIEGHELIEAEERIDKAAVEKLKSGVATTCGGLLL